MRAQAVRFTSSVARPAPSVQPPPGAPPPAPMGPLAMPPSPGASMPGPMGPPGMPPAQGGPAWQSIPTSSQNAGPPVLHSYSAAPPMPQSKTTLGGSPMAGGYAAGPPPQSPAQPAPDAGAAPVASAAYLVQLATLARELAAEANGRCDAAAIRLLRQRLTQWVEDVRSVGGDRDLAAAVEALIKRLSAALAAPASLGAETVAIADELAQLAAGSPPPPAKKSSRLAFWK
jgi:hypothetical protein